VSRIVYREMVVRFFWSLLFFAGYVMFLGPPRAYEIAEKQRANRGELASQPLWVVLLVEAMFRGVLLVGVATIVESFLGKAWYSWLRIDQSVAVLLVAGLIHMLVYYLVFKSRQRRRKAMVGRVYRLLRNIGYAMTPGLAVVTIFLAFDRLKATPDLTEDDLYTTYAVTTVIFLVIGMVEALLVKRRPSGLGSVV